MYVCVVLLIIAELRLIVADLDGKQSWIGTKVKCASAWWFTAADWMWRVFYWKILNYAAANKLLDFLVITINSGYIILIGKVTKNVLQHRNDKYELKWI